jgi:hypothetical protein
VGDVQVLALLTPQVAAAAAAVVGQRALDGHTAGGEAEHRHRPTVINGQLADPEPSLRRQSSVCAHIEDLLVVCDVVAFNSSTSRQEVLVDQQLISACRRTLSTNAPGQDS